MTIAASFNIPPILSNHMQRDYGLPKRFSDSNPRSNPVRLTNRKGEYLNIHSIQVYNGKGEDISASGTPSMSSLYQWELSVGKFAITSGRKNGVMAHTNNEAIEWMNMGFLGDDSLTKVVINNRFNHNCDLRIVGVRERNLIT